MKLIVPRGQWRAFGRGARGRVLIAEDLKCIEKEINYQLNSLAQQALANERPSFWTMIGLV